MSFDVNEVTVLGRLGADPEVKSFQNGGKLANLRVATSESWKDRNTGERQERTEWHSVTVKTDWMVNFVENHLRKGSRVYVRGKLQTRKWQDQNGNDRYSTEVVVAGPASQLLSLDPKGSSGGGSNRQSGGDYGGGQYGGGAGASRDQGMGGGHTSDNRAGGGGSNYDDLDDDIPF